MIGLDTNVLLRYVVRDDPKQAAAADRVIDSAAERGEDLFLCGVVLCELTWVLESGYGYERAAIAKVFDKLLATEQFQLERKDEVRSALDGYREGQADFSDYLIGRLNTAHGCERTATFDGALRGEPGFEVLGS